MTRKSPQERIWLAEYYKCWNATEAARRVPYRWPNKYGPVKKKKFAKEIEAHITEIQMGADEVLIRLADMARGSIEDLVDILPNGHQVIINLEKAKAAGQLHLIKKLKKLPKGGLEIELHDALAALVHIGRHHALFTDKIEQLVKHDLSKGITDKLEKGYGDKGEDG